MKTVIRAATAAPTYFEPTQIQIGGPTDYYALVDGALFAYNPAMCAYVEALKRYPDYDSVIMVSLGTGKLTRRLPYDEVKDWGAARWAQPAFALMCDGICDVVDHQLQEILPEDADGRRQYYRFQARLESRGVAEPGRPAAGRRAGAARGAAARYGGRCAPSGHDAAGSQGGRCAGSRCSGRRAGLIGRTTGVAGKFTGAGRQAVVSCVD
jgi:hypothetical protein